MPQVVLGGWIKYPPGRIPIGWIGIHCDGISLDILHRLEGNHNRQEKYNDQDAGEKVFHFSFLSCSAITLSVLD
jgi:hypothetical protein